MDWSGPGLSPSSLLLITRGGCSEQPGLVLGPEGAVVHLQEERDALSASPLVQEAGCSSHLPLWPRSADRAGSLGRTEQGEGSGEVPGVCTVVRGLGEPED